MQGTQLLPGVFLAAVVLTMFSASSAESAPEVLPRLRLVRRHSFSAQEPFHSTALGSLPSGEERRTLEANTALLQLQDAEAAEKQRPGESLSREKALLSSLPKRLVPPSQEEEGLSKRSRQSLALQLPLCIFSREALGPELGGGTYGSVHPLESAASADCLKDLKTDVKLGAKIFRLRQLESFFRGALDESKPSVITDEAVKQIRNELKQIDFSDELYIQTLKALDESTPVEKLQTLVKEAAPTDTEVYVRLLPHIRDALNTKCFLDELSEVGMVLAQVQKHIREIDPTASANEAISEFSLRGVNEFLWSLPLAAVRIPDSTARPKWGLLMALFEGDMEVKSDLEALDGLSSSSKTASLKPFLRDASLLLNLSAKAVRPFVFMHNVFRFGHFDVKPANLLFTRKAARRPGEGLSLKVAAGDLGMAALLGSSTLLRGTAAFMAPEMERRKGPSEVPSKRRVSAAWDVFALGLTLTQFWSAASGTGGSFLWLERCVKPNLSPGVEFSFKTIASTKGSPIYSPKVLSEMEKCFAVGGGVERAYVHPAPASVAAVLASMVRSNPLLRVSMRHAFEVLKVTQLLSRVAFGASSSKEGDGKDSSSERARRKLISARRSSPLLALIAFQAASPEKVSETDSLNALQRVFKILNGQFLREVVSSAVGKALSLSEALQLTELPNASSAEVEEALVKLRQKLVSLAPQFEYWTVVDSAFGLNEEGLRLLIEEAIRGHKLSALVTAVSRAAYLRMREQTTLDFECQLMGEQLTDGVLSEILNSLGVAVAQSGVSASTPSETQTSEGSVVLSLLEFLKRRAARAYTLWSRMDGLLRIAVNNCQFLRAKKGVQADEAAEGLPSCVLAEAQKMSERIFYGWPWDTLGEEALGLSSKEALDRVTSEFIPSLLRQVWNSDKRRDFLRVQARRAARRLRRRLSEATSSPKDSAVSAEKKESEASTTGLPRTGRSLLQGEGGLWSLANKLLDEMAQDRFVPLPFDSQTVRQASAEVLEAKGLEAFKALVLMAAAEQEAVSASKEVLASLEAETRRGGTETLKSQVASKLDAGVLKLLQRTAKAAGLPEEETASQTLDAAVLEAIAADRVPDNAPSLRVSIDGAFFKAPGGQRRVRPLTKRLVGLPPEALVRDLNAFFQTLILEGFSTSCRSYTAVAHIRERESSDGAYKPLDESAALSQVDTTRFSLRVKALPAADDKTSPVRNNCLLWTKEMLSEGPLVFSPRQPFGQLAQGEASQGSAVATTATNSGVSSLPVEQQSSDESDDSQ